MDFYTELMYALREWQSRRSDVKSILFERKKTLPERDFPQFHQNFKGVIENYTELEAVLKKYSKLPIEKYQTNHKLYMLIAIYGLLYLRKADYAITSQIVELIKQTTPGLSGMSNGILRSIGRDKDKLQAAPLVDSIHPELHDALAADYGERDVAHYLELARDKAPIDLLCLKDRDTVQADLASRGFESEQLPYARFGLRLTGQIQGLFEDEAFHRGDIYVQSQMSQVVGSLIEQTEGKFVLDLAAAPGGKSFTMWRHDPTRQYTLNDVSKAKADRIQQNLRRLRLEQLRVTIFDATRLVGRWIGSFDVVVIDAPCSGSGILIKQAEAKLERTAKQIRELMDRQSAMLDHAAKYVKKQGFLIYSTCSILMGENEERIEQFLHRHPNFRLQAIELDPVLLDGPYLKTTPFDGQFDGFFAGILHRVD
ncbi:MAG TPA: hypothetical protein GXZ74_07195 [Tissierellia bacterium]|nr:hypothetical protein [Tissierellia bacterium]